MTNLSETETLADEILKFMVANENQKAAAGLVSASALITGLGYSREEWEQEMRLSILNGLSSDPNFMGIGQDIAREGIPSVIEKFKIATAFVIGLSTNDITLLFREMDRLAKEDGTEPPIFSFFSPETLLRLKGPVRGVEPRESIGPTSLVPESAHLTQRGRKLEH